jgi:hypothetical protein
MFAQFSQRGLDKRTIFERIGFAARKGLHFRSCNESEINRAVGRVVLLAEGLFDKLFAATK